MRASLRRLALVAFLPQTLWACKDHGVPTSPPPAPPPSPVDSVSVNIAGVGFGPSSSKAASTCNGVSSPGNPYPCCDNDGNCTWYAWKRANDDWGVKLPGGWHDAGQWLTSAQNSGFQTGKTPVVGALVVLAVGPVGHVAYVTAISQDGNTIYVDEMNCCLPGGKHPWCGLGSLEAARNVMAGPRAWHYTSSQVKGYIYRPGVAPPTTEPPAPPSGDPITFTIDVDPGSQSVQRGGVAVYTVTLTNQSDFDGAVDLYAIHLPAEKSPAETGFTPTHVVINRGGTATSTLRIAATAEIPLGTYTTTIEGRSSVGTRKISNSTSIQLGISSAGGVPPQAHFIASSQGKTVRENGVLQLTGPGSASVTLDASLSQPGSSPIRSYTWEVNGNQVATGPTATVAISAERSVINLTVQTDEGVSSKAEATVYIDTPAPSDFAVDVSPASQVVAQGTGATYTVTVRSVNGFSGSVELSALNLPANQSLPGTGFSPTTVTVPPNGSASSTFTIKTNTATPIGSFTIPIQARSSSTTHSTAVALTVQNAATPDYTLEVSPAARTLSQGGSTTYAITLRSINGFSGAVQLYALNLPGNQVLAGTGFSPSTVNVPANGSTTSTLTINTNTATPAGNFTISVEAQTATTTRSAPISLTVLAASQDFSVEVSPASRTVTRGGGALYTVTVRSINGFNGSVGLFALNLPGNQVLAGTGFTPQSLNVPANGSVTSTLTINTNSATPTGSFTVTVEGRSGSTIHSSPIALTVQAPPDPPDFSVEVSPTSRTVTRGGGALYTVTVRSVNGFNGSVDLFALNLPGNQVLAGTGFAPQSVSVPANGSVTSTLTINTNSATPTGSFTVTVEGRSGSTIHSSPISLTVQAPPDPPDFSVEVSPTSQTVTRGGGALYTVTVRSVNGFNGSVDLFAINLPGNQVLAGTGFSPQSVSVPANGSVTSTLTINTNSATPTGSFTVTVEGRSGGVTRSTAVTLSVQAVDFSVEVTPTSRTVTRGGGGLYTVTVHSVNGFNGSVDLFAINLPGNQVLAGTGFSPQSVSVPSNGSATSTLTINTNTATPTGTFTITIEGRSGGTTRSTTITLTVQAPEFSVEASPTSRSVTRGGGGVYTITVRSINGFTGSVDLFAINLPGNQVLAGTGFVPQSVNVPANGSATSTLTINTNGATPTGTFTITIEGRSGGTTRSTPVSLTVS